MDIASLIGVLLGWVLVIVAIIMGGPLGIFVDVPSIMIVFGGTIAASLMCFKLQSVLGVIGICKKVLLYPLPTPTEEIERIVGYSNLARREGLLALEEKIDEVSDDFTRKALRLIIDGFPGPTVREILEIDIENLMARHSEGKKLLDNMGAMAPAFGMIGTLIGLVQMLQNMSDPAGIGKGMAVALLTTFYGAVSANLIYIPFATKLGNRSKEEVELRSLILEGVLAIQAGDKPALVKEKLKSFISPKSRELVDSSK
ncbi:MAG: MotA/TolQ/ExbB proton channel family protein [Planctomycetes bacterium]|nr:MotA/TolQ/ExbB proton channel family protein [Planctomycetota bacterium]MCB9920459.1 MotA/TolQ/ExbB proton channel family protein [Planctomycetota bacterium]